MRSKRQRRIDDLRGAIDCLPERTKTAMLDGIAANTIIVGAYTDRRGGVCPMLAAHRCGGRTNLLAFARAWDRFCDAKEPRTATERELSVLKAHLEASMLGFEGSHLGDAIRDHQASARERRASEASALGLGWTAEQTLTVPAADGARDAELV